MYTSVLNYLHDTTHNFPENIALIDGSVTMNYHELNTRAKEIASSICLRTCARKKPVIVFMEKTAFAVTTFWGILYSGNVYVPLDVEAPVDRINLIIEMIQPELWITDAASLEKSKACKIQPEKILEYQTLLDQPILEDEIQQTIRTMIDTDPAYIICTSGSTGIPKGVVISHRAIIDFTEEASEVMEFSQKEIFANQAPFYFDASVPDLYCTVRNAATLHVIPATMFSFPVKLLEYIRDHKVNAIFWVPSALILVANLRALGLVDISCLKKVMFCGEVMPNKQLNAWRKHLPTAKYVNYYGPSETTYASTYYIVEREFSDSDSLPIGRAAYNTGVLILDDNNQLAKPGEIGELCIRGSSLAHGYYRNPEKTKEVFVQNPLITEYPDTIYRTGDLVRENSYGELEYVCRKDFQIKHLGYRIELGEIENAVSGMANITRNCCLYHDNKKAIVLVYEGKVEKEEILNHLSTKLPKYMIPSILVSLERLPMNANGKIDRVSLKNQYGI